jgi:hypothetical protein
VIAMADPQTEFYTVDRLKHLLRIYPVLGFSNPPDDPEVRRRVRRVIGDASWTEASARAADLERAVRWLNDRDWRAAFVIRAIYIVGLSERDARSYLERQGELVGTGTVHRWKVDGLELLSAYLCGRLPNALDANGANT